MTTNDALISLLDSAANNIHEAYEGVEHAVMIIGDIQELNSLTINDFRELTKSSPEIFLLAKVAIDLNECYNRVKLVSEKHK